MEFKPHKPVKPGYNKENGWFGWDEDDVFPFQSFERKKPAPKKVMPKIIKWGEHVAISKNY